MIERERPAYEIQGWEKYHPFLKDLDRAWEAIEELQKIHRDFPPASDENKVIQESFLKWSLNAPDAFEIPNRKELMRVAYEAGFNAGKKAGR